MKMVMETVFELGKTEIKGNEQKYQLIVENMNDVILLMDIGMNVIYISPSIEKLLGYTPEEFIKLPLNLRVLPQMEMALSTISASSCKSEDCLPVCIEMEQSSKDGQAIWTETLINLVEENDGDCFKFLCSTRNITERKRKEFLLQRSYKQKRINEFFNDLLHDRPGLESEAYDQACWLGIQLPEQFSVFFLSIGNMAQQTHNVMDAIIEQLRIHDDAMIAWETHAGMGIIYPIYDMAERKNKESEFAEHCVNITANAFPGMQVCIGIADYFNSLLNFSTRFKHAKCAVRIGRELWPNQKVYHFEDSGIYQILIHVANADEGEVFVQRTLGALIAHDKTSQIKLVDTLEQLLLGLSVKAVAEQMGVHYKTIQNRKQRIEKILKVTLDSSKVHIMLGTALCILKISRFKMRF